MEARSQFLTLGIMLVGVFMIIKSNNAVFTVLGTMMLCFGIVAMFIQAKLEKNGNY